MRRLFLTLILTCTAAAGAAGLVVHPFDANDPVLGTALAQRVAEALGDDVIGPGATPALLAPIVAPNGFLSPAVFVDDPALGGRNAAWLLRGVVGADAALTGRLDAVGDDLRLHLEGRTASGERRATLVGPRDDPGALADRAAAVVAGWTGRSARALDPFDLLGADGDLGRALSLVAAGLPRDALASLEQQGGVDAADARLRDLASTLRRAVDGAGGTAAGAGPATRDPHPAPAVALDAVIALNLGDLDAAAERFAALAALGVPVGDVWVGVIAHNGGDAAAAAAAFDRAAARADYPHGVAARAAYRFVIGDASGAAADLDRLTRVASLDPAASLVGVIAANLAGDALREDAIAARLERGAPFLTFGFERRSFLAFDRDDALGAARALAVAIELAPDSDLYWTNYGWALYLLGFLERSEAASRRAIELDPAQYIARYNLGLVLVVTDRLEAALQSYREALRSDPQVDPEAVADLVEAEAAFPDAVGVPYARALLEAARGERAAAADAYERYVAAAERHPDHPAVTEARVREARDRVAALRAPLPPIEIEGAIDVRLGLRGPALDAVHPGDPVVVRFEVTTRGDALPARLALEAALVDAGGNARASVERLVDVPSGAIGYVVEVARLELPSDLDAGRYDLVVVAAGDGLEATTTRAIDVTGAAEPLRAIVGRDVVMLSLETQQPLVGARDLTQTDAAVGRLLAELRGAAAVAEEVLPLIEVGRFEGLGGARAFGGSTADDVLDFLRFLVADGTADATFTFVDAYAEWVLQGAP